jgi:hypothetical protein
MEITTGMEEQGDSDIGGLFLQEMREARLGMNPTKDKFIEDRFMNSDKSSCWLYSKRSNEAQENHKGA